MLFSVNLTASVARFRSRRRKIPLIGARKWNKSRVYTQDVGEPRATNEFPSRNSRSHS